MKRICRIEDIQGMEGWPKEFVAVLEKRFHELMKIYQGNEDSFTLEPYGEMVLVERYEEIQGLLFEEVIPLMVDDEKIFQCLYVPNNDKCIEFFILESRLCLAEVNLLMKQNM